ncbi:MAG: hypothetical protein Udaeo2_29540 [Candidatus Udaeobacter sp.]|nr:MAG: hypothetical protein Udaeo2_29540 [Candidatus Udaeobacter sp.]
MSLSIRQFSISTVLVDALCLGARVRVEHPLFGIQAEPSRPVETAAEIVERVVRFVVRSTTD